MAGPSSRHRGVFSPRENSYFSLVFDGTEVLRVNATTITPNTNDGVALGSTTLQYADLFLATGAVINFNNGDVLLTHSANVLTMSGGDLVLDNNTGMLIGDPTQLTVSTGDGSSGLTPELQIIGTGPADTAILMVAFSTTATRANAPKVTLAKGGSATIVVGTVLTDNEVAGVLIAYGDDGTDIRSPVGSIEFVVDGTPGTGDMPGSIEFYRTIVGGETLTLSLTLAASGHSTFTAGNTPASISGTPGTPHEGAITSTGGLGGDTTISTTGVGGIGAGYSYTAGAGGVAASATTSSTGGAGGAWAVTTGAGGVGTVSGSGTEIGGAGGALSLTTGVGGAVTTGTGTNTGGASGALSITTGVGGAAQDGTDTGGVSGAITITTGTGGAGDTGGASGDITFQTGAGGSGGSPVTGNIIFNTGGATLRMTIDDTVITAGTGMDIQMSTTGFIIYAITDSDSAVEAAMWYSAADNKLEFFNGSTKEAITSSGFLWQAYENPTIYRQMYSPYFNGGINPDVFVKEGTWVDKPLIPGLSIEQFEWHVGDKSIMVVESFLSDGEVHALPYPFEEALRETKWAASYDERLRAVEEAQGIVANGWLKEQFTELVENDEAFRSWAREKLAV